MTIEIQIANKDDALEWDRIISESPHGTLFHQWNWLKITEKHTQTRLYPIFGIKNGIPVAIFPLFFRKRGPARMVFSPPPHAALFYLGPVLIGFGTLRQEKWEHMYVDFQNLVEKFIINELRANYISISLSPALQDSRPFTWSGYRIEPNFDYNVDLTQGIDSLYGTLNNRQRADLKKAKEMGMVVEMGEKNEFDKILDLMDIRYKQQAKVVTTSKDYLSDIYDMYNENLKIFVVKLGDEIVTGAIRLSFRENLYGWIGNPKPKNRISPSPNHLLFWKTIQYASEQGFNNYITMSAAGNERLHEYYAARFNPELKIRYIATKKSFLAGLSEKGYRDILKPLRGRIKYFISQESTHTKK
jgi:hypothetical protein